MSDACVNCVPRCLECRQTITLDTDDPAVVDVVDRALAETPGRHRRARANSILAALRRYALRADDLDGPLGPGRDDNPGDQ